MITSRFLPGQLFGVFFGGVLGNHFYEKIGWVTSAILFFIIVRLIGERVGRYFLDNRL